ncbi:MAG: hypothetical protein OER97_10315 [Gammaproteobacteria bacterium]|nr:hypothetical protein [Gammaproteobacteria bacterium]
MSTWKSARVAAQQEPVKQDVPADTESEQPPAPQVKITSLEIEVDPEIGCDPYNSTGQFCIEEIKKFKE